jgi:hypothetical protein
MRQSGIFRIAAIAVAFIGVSPAVTWAHCDTMNGPVVKAARQALDSRDIRFALIWVQPADEPEIRSAFEKTLGIRALGSEAKSLADQYFFETLVRIHRAGEGASYTGLKDADVPLEPEISAAEHSLEAKSVKDLSTELTGMLQQQLQAAFRRVQSGKTFKPSDVDAGRRYVATYVRYIHYVERLYKAIGSADASHASPAEEHVH